MVGILIVSHSKEVAQGAKELAAEMMQGDVPLEAVGGTKDGRLGTDSNLIYEALTNLNNADGVIILADMGSSVMNTELAFEFFSEEEQEKFKIVNAPLVEGAINAALQSSFGKDLDEVIAALDPVELAQKKV
ncbi:dihydroxyacetone kinase phosphoryl donor subunit DhaM [Halanaerobacter jeridensis]|uniref:phosphoenolpyruvate--glycerone phosphotransferase n=1 Tax=Halanaerobacter jeridensis TaxID=706427 RepID=A0A938XNQ0_9FIRM|nr:dihydroxyacetone kinase phosphoryl donor subunit DhaM [Halanaerobacter jeridensis]MBM7556123.1 dihydroxyacetone kinase phosphotransfer subunit [Halanaerobacter jeridensis]